MKFVFLLSFLFFCIHKVKSQDSLSWQKINARHTPTWYTNAKFGIFIHWGVYAVPSWATNSNADGFGSNYAEWYWQRLTATNLKIHPEFKAFHEKVYGANTSYKDLAPLFKAELFDAAQWAKIIKNSGAKYVVLTSKHHDGYCLWPSAQAADWNALTVGPKRNLLQEISEAVKKEQLKMGLYYSLYEWFNPLYKSNTAAYVNGIVQPQLKDIVQNYKPDIIWADGDWEQKTQTWRSAEFINWLYFESIVKDSVVTNDRWGSDAKKYFTSGIYTSEYGSANFDNNKTWEETRGIGQSFGYNRNENLEQYATSEALVHELIKVVSKGGNLLLNIGPTADGRIPVIMQQRLSDIGTWLKINGEAIYNTTGNVFNNSNDSVSIFFTKKENDIFCINTNWQNQLVIENIAKPVSVKLLGYTGNIKYSYSKKKLIIKTPLLNPKTIPCNYAWTYKLSF